MRKVQLLAQLQRLDTALDRARERLVAVRVQLDDSSAVAQLEAEHHVAQENLRHKAGEQRDLELEVDDLQQKLTTLEKKLYSGTVMNPKELGAMTDEARQYRHLISVREDRLIELYDIVAAVSAAAAAVSARLDEARTQYSNQQAALGAERDELEGEIRHQQCERQTLLGEIDPLSLRSYDGLRRTRAGLAVAEVAQRTCQGCRISLPASEEIRARTSPELVFCGSCGRILHAGL